MYTNNCDMCSNIKCFKTWNVLLWCHMRNYDNKNFIKNSYVIKINMSGELN